MSSVNSTLSLRKRILFSFVLFLIAFFLIEISLRVVFAFQAGPKVLLYGTSYYRNVTETIADPDPDMQVDGEVILSAHRKGDHVAVGNTGNTVDSKAGNYLKYFPNERKTDFDKDGKAFEVTINKQGFRGPDFSIDKAPGVIRVVTLGASSTFGYYDRDNETYPYYLEQQLNKNSGEGSYEVLNLGIPHSTSQQIRALFYAEALPLDPDIVTFYEGINDSSLMPEKAWEEKVSEEHSDSFVRKIRRMLSSLRVLKNVYVGARERLLTLSLLDSLLVSDVITYDQQDLSRHIEGKSELFLQNISDIREACRDRGIEFIVIKQQARSMGIDDINGLTYEEEIELIREKLARTNSITHSEKTFLTHKVLNDDLEQWAIDNDVHFLDAVKILDQDRDTLLSWVHLSPRGNQIIAQSLAEKILAVSD